VVQGAQVKARATATNLEIQATSKADGSFSIADLPIGAYEVKFIKDGFETDVHPKILVQGNRTAAINAKLAPGKVTASVTVEATPLLNETDTTTGYTLSELQITETPLGTGSFTQLAILSPGVSADLLNTAGTNAGLGNQAIFGRTGSATPATADRRLLRGTRLSGCRGRVRDHDHPNRVPYASDAHVHPTIYDWRSSSVPALRVVHDAGVLPARSYSHGAQWLRAACGPRAQRGAGNRRDRRGGTVLR
jgi:hypothetical protein